MAATTKVATEIEGFDEITHGGLPRGRTTLVVGGPGCGKTVFALQTLVNGAQRWKEPGMFVAFEESADHIIANASTFGWDLRHLAKKQLFFLDARLSPEVVKAGDFDLLGMLSVLKAKAEEIGAKRIVFDGIDVLLSLLDDPAAARRELYRVRDWLAKTGLTGIITQKVGTEHDGHYNFLQFMVDCVVSLEQHVASGAVFRTLRVVKYRGSDFVADEFSISLGQQGLQLSTRGPAELHYKVTNERVSSGLPRLDHMLCGGYHRGSNVLISGSPGTAKSTLAGLFIAAACARGERALFISFDEGASQIVRNLESVGIELGPYQKSGLLEIYSTRTRGANIETQFAEMRRRVQAHRPRCVVVDPLSALSTGTTHIASGDVAQRFLDFLKEEEITTINTSLMAGLSSDEVTATRIATVADTWIQVSYVEQDGEHNRSLTIVKSRGTGHSNQVRELKLSHHGVDLADVFVAHGKVLMGVARWEHEQEESAIKKRSKVAAELERLQLELAQAEAAARLQVIQMEMDGRTAELEMLAASSGQASKRRATDREALRKMRHADEELGPTSGPPRTNGHGKA
jgi:circadian clock protein KaiC